MASTSTDPGRFDVRTDLVEVTRDVDASPAAVWSVLADGWLYPGWVVGASRMRAVDESWPAAGSSLHHSVGLWPLLIDDRTSVLVSDPTGHLRLKARAWPAGAAVVDIRLRGIDGGTRIVMREDIVSGPGLAVPAMVRQRLLAARNREVVRRVAFIAERR